MNPAIEKLLEKETLTGADMGRFYLACWVDRCAGIPIDKELAGKRITTMEGWKGVYSPEYDAYRLVYVTLDNARRVYIDKIRLAQAACAGLALFQECVFFANSDYPDCLWQRYKLGELKPDQLALRLDLWTRLRNSIAESLAIWGAFKAVGAWLEISGLTATLIDDKPLREQVQEMNKFAGHAKTKLKKLDLSEKAADEAKEVFEPCAAFRRQPREKALARIERSFVLNHTFDSQFPDAVGYLNPCGEERVGGRGYDGEKV